MFDVFWGLLPRLGDGMKIFCLFAQRNCLYDGQYEPELLAAIDDIGNDENPEYLDSEESEAKNSGEFSLIRRITISISTNEFEKAFYGFPLKGTVE
jgi:hypothetical protein